MNAGRSVHLRNARYLISCACVLGGSVLFAHANDTKPSAHATEARTCASCHSAALKSFAESGHGHILPKKVKQLTCATCHGSQKVHVASGGSTAGMVDPALASAAQVDAMCLTCHARKHANFLRSPHGKSSVGCTSCHSIHHAAAPKFLLKAAQTELCYKCHAQVEAQFTMPSRHNLSDGLILCTDCHNPHGTRQEEAPGSGYRQDAFCTDCHSATAGPFVYEHGVMKTEGCTACHFAHGGPNPHLLLRANVDAICHLCHLPPQDPKTGAHVQGLKTAQTSTQSCTDCHADVHGSKSSKIFRRIN